MADDVAALFARIRAHLDADEQIALAASVGNFGGSTPTGEHWRWECITFDTEVPIDPVTVLDEHLICPACGSYQLGLRSVERYDPRSVGSLPHMVVDTEELRPADGLHIARHDPARVLATVAALRKVLDIIEAGQAENWGASALALREVLTALGQVGGDHG